MNDKITLVTTDFKTGKQTRHEATCAQLRTGTIKNVFSLIDADALIKNSKGATDFVTNLTAAILVSYPIFEAELLSIFPDLTQDDLDNNTTIGDVAGAIADLVLYTIGGLGKIGERIKKNLGLEA